jgi:hypothetical protein
MAVVCFVQPLENAFAGMLQLGLKIFSRRFGQKTPKTALTGFDFRKDTAPCNKAFEPKLRREIQNRFR